jgi:hypothetical protein
MSAECEGLILITSSTHPDRLGLLACFPTFASFVFFHVNSRLTFCSSASLRSPRSPRFEFLLSYCSVVSTVVAVAEDGT